MSDLSAVISETLRIQPAVPIVLRELTPRTIDGVERKAGDIIGIAGPAVHFDPAIWSDPRRFRPERFRQATPTPSGK